MSIKCGTLRLSDYEDPAYTNHPFVGGRRLIYRKQWEIVTELMAIEDCLHPDALVLVVGAGHENTLYYLAGLAKLVFATDLYLDPGDWVEWADRQIMTAPMAIMPKAEAHSPDWVFHQGHNPKRIIGLHRDGRNLHLPDGLFDAVICTSSIEHFGAYDADENPMAAALDMGRVLKPGGVLSICTEFKISGEGGGWPGVRLFDAEGLQRLIVAPSGCELMAPLDLGIDDATLASAFPLEDWVNGNRPHGVGVVTHKGYTFTSVHLAMRKPL